MGSGSRLPKLSSCTKDHRFLTVSWVCQGLWAWFGCGHPRVDPHATYTRVWRDREQEGLARRLGTHTGSGRASILGDLSGGLSSVWWVPDVTGHAAGSRVAACRSPYRESSTCVTRVPEGPKPWDHTATLKRAYARRPGGVGSAWARPEKTMQHIRRRMAAVGARNSVGNSPWAESGSLEGAGSNITGAALSDSGCFQRLISDCSERDIS